MRSTWQQLEDIEQGYVIPFPELPGPDKQRISEVRSHLFKLAISRVRVAAIITMAITEDGAIQLSATGIEEEHARALLDEIDLVRLHLKAFLADQPRGPPAKVVPFPR